MDIGRLIKEAQRKREHHCYFCGELLGHEETIQLEFPSGFWRVHRRCLAMVRADISYDRR